MSELEAALTALLARLVEQEARFAIVGGLAVSARTEPRFTRDADVCVAVEDDREAEAVVRSLRSAGYRVLAIVEQETTGRIATVRLAAESDRDDGVVLDLLFASSGVERSRFPVQVPSVEVMRAALGTRARFGISYWDAAILEAGRALGCPVVLPEHLDDGTDIDGIRVEDPFRRVA